MLPSQYTLPECCQVFDFTNALSESTDTISCTRPILLKISAVQSLADEVRGYESAFKAFSHTYRDILRASTANALIYSVYPDCRTSDCPTVTSSLEVEDLAPVNL
jgi:hypothetical protein